MNRQRAWFGLLLRWFPNDHRDDYGQEIVDLAVTASATSRRSWFSESAAFSAAGMRVRLRRGFDAPLAAQIRWGAAVVLGFLLAVAPLQRAIGQRGGFVGGTTDRAESFVAVILVLVAVKAATRSRPLAMLIGLLGILAAASSTTVGGDGWSLADSLYYEARWLVPSLLVVIAGTPKKPSTSAAATAVASLILSTIVAAGAGVDPFGRTYGFAIGLVAQNPIVLAAGLVVLVAMWFVRSLPGRLVVVSAQMVLYAGISVSRSGEALAIAAVFHLVVLATYLDSRRRKLRLACA